jgi:hypothetical protein
MILNQKTWTLISRDSDKPVFACEQPVKPVVKPKAKMEAKEKSQPVAMVFEDGLGTSCPTEPV